jgi:hypothetical protein
MSNVKIKGFDKLQKQLKSMEKSAKDLESTKEVSFGVLFNSSFMRTYTNFESFDELLTAGGFVVNNQDDFKAIPDDEFDSHVRNTTKFDSWQQMLNTATEKFVVKKLGF